MITNSDIAEFETAVTNFLESAATLSRLHSEFNAGLALAESLVSCLDIVESVETFLNDQIVLEA